MLRKLKRRFKRSFAPFSTKKVFHDVFWNSLIIPGDFIICWSFSKQFHSLLILTSGQKQKQQAGGPLLLLQEYPRRLTSWWSDKFYSPMYSGEILSLFANLNWTIAEGARFEGLVSTRGTACESWNNHPCRKNLSRTMECIHCSVGI